MKRICIFFFWDKHGIVDDYVVHYLKSLKPFFKELCVVVNGEITELSKSKLIPYADNIILRENKGLDAGAYQFAILHYGYNKLAEFDELLCTNFTYYGPFYPLNEMFSEMEKQNCDWWGLYKWHINAYRGKPEYRHIPSFFVVYRKTLISNKLFRDYWDNLEDTSTYELSVLNHEQKQTPFFDKHGFKCKTFIDDTLFSEYWNTNQWPLVCADTLIMQYKFPFIKRRNFFLENGEFIYPKVLLNIIPFIKKCTKYNLHLIKDNIARTQNFEYKKVPFFTFLKWKILSKIHISSKHRKRYQEKIERNNCKHFEYIWELF